jgi:signal peptidase II
VTALGSDGSVDSRRQSRSRGTARGSLIVALVVGIVIVIDQVTKHWAVSQLDDGRVVHVVWTLQFNLAFNSGMAFGRGRGWGPVIGVVAMLVVVALVLSIRRQNDTRMSLAVGLVVAGALGNIIDRLFRNEGWLRGRVVDFIDFQWFPIFNVADIAVNVGGILLLWFYVRASTSSKSV